VDAGVVLLDATEESMVAVCDVDALVVAEVVPVVEEGTTELPVPDSLLDVSLCDSFWVSSSLFSEAGETAYVCNWSLELVVLLLDVVFGLGVPYELASSEELAFPNELGSADEAGSADDSGAVDLVGCAEVSDADEVAGSAEVSGAVDEVDSAEGSGAVDEVGSDELGSDESVDTTTVVLDVDPGEERPGRSTVTAAVVNAVVLPKASTLAVTATTRSASEFVLIMSDTAAVP
jgi:hypothetical protein